MPLWKQVHREYEIGERCDNHYWVAEIKRMVPMGVRFGNSNARAWNKMHPDELLEMIPEEELTYVRLVGSQMRLPGF